jgi:hypothetical protein
MFMPERVNTDVLGRLEPDRVLRGLDPQAFKLHVAFRHSHGSPRGELTTLSSAGTVGWSTQPRRDGAHRR